MPVISIPLPQRYWLPSARPCATACPSCLMLWRLELVFGNAMASPSPFPSHCPFCVSFPLLQVPMLPSHASHLLLCFSRLPWWTLKYLPKQVSRIRFWWLCSIASVFASNKFWKILAVLRVLAGRPLCSSFCSLPSGAELPLHDTTALWAPQTFRSHFEESLATWRMIWKPVSF